MPEAKGWAAFDPKSPMRPFSFERREPGARDVLIDILYCGICHSDLHQVRNEWAGTRYPIASRPSGSATTPGGGTAR